MNDDCRFIEPLDVLFLRGNKLFGEPGSHGESLVPPWPSVAAGALRSRMLADDRVDFVAFGRGEADHATLGTPDAPGRFTVTAFHLARRHRDGRVEVLMAMPADLVVREADDSAAARRLQPTDLPQGVLASSSLPLLPTLAETNRSKPVGGYWLSEAGWSAYVAGKTPPPNELLKSEQLWAMDHRVGVGLDAQARRAADGKLFSVQAVCLNQHHHTASQGCDIGFFVSTSGASLPRGGTVRLGGDGRAAALHECDAALPEVDYAAVAQSGQCRIVLTTPGIFANGWRLAGTDADGRFELNGVRGRLVCAAVPRAETVSGWDLARRRPKSAQRVAPTGSVYWLKDLETTPEALRKLVATGLWHEEWHDGSRRAEGFNRIAICVY